jgi:hypothetical protein
LLVTCIAGAMVGFDGAEEDVVKHMFRLIAQLGARLDVTISASATPIPLSSPYGSSTKGMCDRTLKW